MIKNYSVVAYNDLIKSLEKHTSGGNSMYVLRKMIDDCEDKWPGIKDRFIHDMGSFLSHWFELVNESHRCSRKLQAKILTKDMVLKYSDFNNVTTFCYDVIDNAVNPYTNRLYTRDILSYMDCVIKAVVQTTRRHHGFDTNSKKY